GPNGLVSSGWAIVCRNSWWDIRRNVKTCWSDRWRNWCMLNNGPRCGAVVERNRRRGFERNLLRPPQQRHQHKPHDCRALQRNRNRQRAPLDFPFTRFLFQIALNQTTAQSADLLGRISFFFGHHTPLQNFSASETQYFCHAGRRRLPCLCRRSARRDVRCARPLPCLDTAQTLRFPSVYSSISNLTGMSGCNFYS